MLSHNSSLRRVVGPFSIFFLVLTPICLPAQGTFTTIDYPGASRTWVSAINNDGTIVGNFFLDDETPHGFILDAEGFHHYDVPVGYNRGTTFSGLNDVGQMVGIYTDQFRGANGFLLDSGEFSRIDYHLPYAINNAGQMAARLGVLDHGTFTPIRYPGADATATTGINDAGQLSGWYHTNSDQITRGFTLDDNGFTSFSVPDAVTTETGHINNGEQVVGDYILTRTDPYIHGFLWSANDGFTVIDVEGAIWTRPRGINGAGVVVGTYSLEGVRTHGFIWQNN